MIIGKEQLIYFEDLAKKQVRIYPDACDAGYLLNEKTKAEARENIVALMKDYNYQTVKQEDCSYTTIIFPVELVDGDPEMTSCIKMDISYTNDEKYKKEFLSIYFKRIELPNTYKFFR